MRPMIVSSSRPTTHETKLPICLMALAASRVAIVAQRFIPTPPVAEGLAITAWPLPCSGCRCHPAPWSAPLPSPCGPVPDRWRLPPTVLPWRLRRGFSCLPSAAMAFPFGKVAPCRQGDGPARPGLWIAVHVECVREGVVVCGPVPSWGEGDRSDRMLLITRIGELRDIFPIRIIWTILSLLSPFGAVVISSASLRSRARGSCYVRPIPCF